MKFLKFFLPSIITIMTIWSCSVSAAPSCVQLLNLAKAPIQNQTDVLNYVAQNLNEQKTDEVIKKFLDIFEKSTLSVNDRAMSEGQFHNLYVDLKDLANSYGIKIEPMIETMGVFPKGLDLIGIAGFSEPSYTISHKSVNFAKRHELAHLFHVLALRAILVENTHELSALNRMQLSKFVEAIEGGRNYIEFEMMVTDISGFLHVLSPLKSGNERYSQKLKTLLQGLKPALLSGRVKYKNGWGLIEIYAKFVSKAPLVLGKSFSDLALRMPFIFFADSYLVNESFRNWVHLILSNL